MKQNPAKANVHFFICCQQRDNQQICCAQRCSEDLVRELKRWIVKENLKDLIKVSRSFCLGFCQRGITACLYPQNKWFTDIRPSDSKKIMAMLRENSTQKNINE